MCVRCRVVVKEARPEARRRPSGKLAQHLHHGGQLAAVKVCVDSFADWEEPNLLCLNHGGRHQNEVQEKARQDRKECVYYSVQ